MITLYSYPGLFGVADNNPYGLKTFAFLKLCKLPFRHEHILDPKDAPHGQLPYIVDDDAHIGDSDAIVVHLIKKYDLEIDGGLTPAQRDAHLMIRRVLDDLYWVMSYSRWSDERFWPLFRDAFMNTHPGVSSEVLEAAREYNFQRYYYQGIGRYETAAVYERGVADIETLVNIQPQSGYFFGPQPTSIDAAIYGFIANIYFYTIDTPLKACVLSYPDLVKHCLNIHSAVSR
jgi:glutathione S-transferase